MGTGRVLAVMLGVAILCLGVTSCDDDERPRAEPTPVDHYSHYMPLDLGNKWTYDVAISIKSAPAENHVYVYEVTEVKRNYQGYAKAYVITVTKDGTVAGTIMAGCRDDACCIYDERWLLLLSDTMATGTENGTGFVWENTLTYEYDDDITCPAGTFPACKLLRYLYAEVDNTTDVYEYYARDVGLVRYSYSYEYRGMSMPHEPYDWGTTTYELKSYEIHHNEEY